MAVSWAQQRIEQVRSLSSTLDSRCPNTRGHTSGQVSCDYLPLDSMQDTTVPLQTTQSPSWAYSDGRLSTRSLSLVPQSVCCSTLLTDEVPAQDASAYLGHQHMHG